jgi:hypothetical protein
MVDMCGVPRSSHRIETSAIERPDRHSALRRGGVGTGTCRCADLLALLSRHLEGRERAVACSGRASLGRLLRRGTGTRGDDFTPIQRF